MCFLNKAEDLPESSMEVFTVRHRCARYLLYNLLPWFMLRLNTRNSILILTIYTKKNQS